MRALLVPCLLLLAACAPSPDQDDVAAPAAVVVEATPAPPPPPAGDPGEGARVARRVGCDGCHGERGQGEALWPEPGQFEVQSPNLTVVRANYDDAGLAALLREGRTHDGHRPLGMPVVMFQHLSDREVRDILAWVRSLPTLDNPEARASWFSEEIVLLVRGGT